MADAFESEIEELVRRMSRELAREITALILGRLGIDTASARRLAPGATSGTRRGPRGNGVSRSAGGVMAKSPKRKTKSDGTPRARRHRPTSDERVKNVEHVERVLAQSTGLALGEIERASGLRRSAVASALKALKDEGRVFMGGTRRFARYATTQHLADKSSQEARHAGR